MPGKLDQYALGSKGIDLVSSPIHVENGALLLAQNAELPIPSGQGSLGKRRGMTKLNTTAAAGSILALTNIPLYDPIVERVTTGAHLFLLSAIDEIYGSPDGTTWTLVDPTFYPYVANSNFRTRHPTLDGAFYYGPGDNGGPITKFDGDTVTELTPVASTFATSVLVTGPMLYRGEVLCAVTDALAGSTYTFGLYQWTGAAWALLAQRSAEWLGLSPAWVEWGGKLYFASAPVAGNGASQIFTWDGSAWEVATTFTPANDPTEFYDAIFWNGSLYFCGPADATDPHGIVKFDGTTWTDITPAGYEGGDFYSVAEFDGKLFFSWDDVTGNKVVSYDGSSFALDEDIATTHTARVYPLAVYNGYMYAAGFEDGGTDARVLRRAVGGAWSVVFSGPAAVGARLGIV